MRWVSVSINGTCVRLQKAAHFLCGVGKRNIPLHHVTALRLVGTSSKM